MDKIKIKACIRVGFCYYGHIKTKREKIIMKVNETNTQSNVNTNYRDLLIADTNTFIRNNICRLSNMDHRDVLIGDDMYGPTFNRTK